MQNCFVSIQPFYKLIAGVVGCLPAICPTSPQAKTGTFHFLPLIALKWVQVYLRHLVNKFTLYDSIFRLFIVKYHTNSGTQLIDSFAPFG